MREFIDYLALVGFALFAALVISAVVGLAVVGAFALLGRPVVCVP